MHEVVGPRNYHLFQAAGKKGYPAVATHKAASAGYFFESSKRPAILTYATESTLGISPLKAEFPLNHAVATEVEVYSQGRVVHFVSRSLPRIHRPAAYVSWEDAIV